MPARRLGRHGEAGAALLHRPPRHPESRPRLHRLPRLTRLVRRDGRCHGIHRGEACGHRHGQDGRYAFPISASSVSARSRSHPTAIDNAKSHVRVNAVCPGWVDTPLTDATVRWWPYLEKSVHEGNLLGRIATVEEVADYIVFLCSPFASYINGTGLVIDAGASCGVSGY